MLAALRAARRLSPDIPYCSLSTSSVLRTHYQTLGVPKTASAKQIKTAYFDLSKKYHPDVNPDEPDAQDTFVKITEAYAILSNKESKAKYDSSINPVNRQEIVYRKTWTPKPGDMSMNDFDDVQERMDRWRMREKKEKHKTAFAVALVATTVAFAMGVIKVKMMRGDYSDGNLAMDQFEKQQHRYRLVNASPVKPSMKGTLMTEDEDS